MINSNASGRVMSLALTALALWVAGSACIITIPKRGTAATSSPTPNRAEAAGRLERMISAQATQLAELGAAVRSLEGQVQAQATMLHYLATARTGTPPCC